MSLNEIIAEAIDCPMMDCKNVADIIAGYCQYNILDADTCKTVRYTIDSNSHTYDDFMYLETEDKIFYKLEGIQYCKFHKGKPHHPAGIERDMPLEYQTKRPEQYLYIPHRDMYDEGFFCWKIVRRWECYKGFRKAYRRDICKWGRLLQQETLLQDRKVGILFSNTSIWSWQDEDEDGNPNDYTDDHTASITGLFDYEEF
jgi:hypothetical protein